MPSTEAEYVALSLAAREITWLKLLFTKLELLKPYDQFVDIHIDENNKYAEVILSSNSTLYLECIPSQSQVPISSQNSSIEIKGDNQSFIALAKNLILYIQIKHIDIQDHYNWDEVISKRINLVYTPIKEMLADGLKKPLLYVKIFLTLSSNLG